VDINSQINKVSEVMAEIAAASDQQTQGVEQVNTAMEQINQVTQQTAANAEESASAAEELASQAEEMKALVHSFELSSHDRPSAHRSGTPRARRPAAVPVSARNARNRTASSDPRPASPNQDLHTRKEDPAMMIPFDDLQEDMLGES
jgi:uncharacterized phage infection (PIP) family protein YhgE